MTRRLFTHLFLPGDALSGWIRAALWLGVPSPELSIMLVDWSSLSHVGRRSRSRRRRGGTGGTPDDDGDGGIAPISPIAAPVLLSLLAGNWGTARRLVFGQVLAAGQSNADSSRNGVLIGRRNDRAVDVLRQSLSSPPSSSSGRDGDRGDVDGVVDPAGGGGEEYRAALRRGPLPGPAPPARADGGHDPGADRVAHGLPRHGAPVGGPRGRQRLGDVEVEGRRVVLADVHGHGRGHRVHECLDAGVGRGRHRGAAAVHAGGRVRLGDDHRRFGKFVPGGGVPRRHRGRYALPRETRGDVRRHRKVRGRLGKDRRWHFR